MNDVVIDTNVLAHAQDPDNPRFEDSFSLLAQLLRCDTKLCLDEPHNPRESDATTSLIGAEYRDVVRPGSPGFAILVRLFSTARFKVVGTKVGEAERKWGNANLKKPRDRTFFRVTLCSDERTLVSHDYEDFTEVRREEARKRFAALICAAGDALRLL